MKRNASHRNVKLSQDTLSHNALLYSPVATENAPTRIQPVRGGIDSRQRALTRARKKVPRPQREENTCLRGAPCAMAAKTKDIKAARDTRKTARRDFNGRARKWDFKRPLHNAPLTPGPAAAPTLRPFTDTRARPPQKALLPAAACARCARQARAANFYGRASSLYTCRVAPCFLCALTDVHCAERARESSRRVKRHPESPVYACAMCACAYARYNADAASFSLILSLSRPSARGDPSSSLMLLLLPPRLFSSSLYAHRAKSARIECARARTTREHLARECSALSWRGRDCGSRGD